MIGLVILCWCLALQFRIRRASHVSLYSIFPAKVTGEPNPERSYILAIFLRISLLVTLTIGAGKATSIVCTVLLLDAPRCLKKGPFEALIIESSPKVF